MIHKTFTKSVISLAISSCFVASSVAWGQMLEEVVVTAQKRAESVQDIPIAITALSGSDIEKLGWEKPNDVAAQVPNMQVSAPLGDVQPLFSIRGVSMVDYTPSQASPIGVYMDEGYLGATYTHGMAQFDLERIEVLRGPQGTLYGKNTTGGAINLLSNTPDIDAGVDGYVKLGVQNFNGTLVEGAVENTLVEGKLAGRIAIKSKHVDGYWKNAIGPDMNETDYTTARVGLNWEPTETFGAVFKYTYAKSDAKSAAPRIDATTPLGTTLAGLPSNKQRHGGSINRAGDTVVKSNIANLRLNWDIGNYSIVSVTNGYDAEYFARTDTDGTEATLAGIDWASETKAFAQDLRLVSNLDGPFNFIAGIYYGNEDIDTHILHEDFFHDPDGAIALTLTKLSIGAGLQGDPALSAHLAVLADALPEFGMVDRRFDVEKESYAVYTDMTFDATDRLSFNLGLRYTSDETTRDYINYSRFERDGTPMGSFLPGNKLSAQFIAMGIDAPFVTWALSQGVPIPAGTYLDGVYTTDSGEVRSEKETAVTGKLAINYQINDDSMVYGSYSKGFRSGSFNNGLVYADQKNENGAYVKPEYIDAYEIGFKSEFFDSMLRLNGAAFYYDYQDQQFVTQVGISANLYNAGGADIKGLELELLAAPTEGLTLQAGLGLLDAEYTELYLPKLSTPLNPVDEVDLKGNTPVSSPELNFNFMVDYEFDISDTWYSAINFNGTFTDDQWFSAYNEAEGHEDISQEAYWVMNARLTFADKDDRLAVSLWVRNLADEEYDVYAINLQGGFGTNYFMEGAPRMYGAELTYRF
ncbi:MAG: TonB-dependent receptor [Pseudomonadales bacterium]